MIRNQELLVVNLIWWILVIALCIFSRNSQYVFWILITAILTWIVFMSFTLWRYAKIKRMSALIDRALMNVREISFDTMREGELAVLASDLDKLCNKIIRSNDIVLEEKRLLTRALADISHQIKTPLTSSSLIIANLESKALKDRLSEDYLNKIEDLNRLQERLIWLVTSLLKLARFDAQTITLNRTAVSAYEVIQEVYQTLEPLSELREVALVNDIDPRISITVDTRWCAEALINVIKNCLEHTPAQGSIRTYTTSTPFSIKLIIEDTGPGINSCDLPHIFERFWRSSQEVNPHGIGIGLALAQSIIHAHEGRIAAENVLRADGTSQGARFIISLNRQAPPSHTPLFVQSPTHTH